MGRISWAGTSERFYESGLDRGVLFVNGVGVPWVGLVSVSEDPSVQDASYYQDGFKFFSGQGVEEFSGTIQTYTYPDEFLPCIGIDTLLPGFYVTNQPQKPFDFSYRTFVGNDVDGEKHSYKLHFVYQATVRSGDVDRQTMEDSINLFEHSIKFETVPQKTKGRAPLAHLPLDARYLPNSFMSRVESIVYGTDTTDPRMPSVSEIVDILAESND